jgi:hypothetical protein
LCHAVTLRAKFHQQSPFHWLLPSVLVMTPVFSHIQSHEREQEKAAELLQDARNRAFKTRGYNFVETHKKLVAEFHTQNDNIQPYEWQLDVSVALILGLDCTVIAGTGAGKTMPFVMIPWWTIPPLQNLGQFFTNHKQGSRILNLLVRNADLISPTKSKKEQWQV